MCVCVGKGRKTENPCLEIYVASFPFSKQLKLGSLFPGHHRIQTSGIDAERIRVSVTIETFTVHTRPARHLRGPFVYVEHRCLVTFVPGRERGFQCVQLTKRNLISNTCLLISFLHLLSYFMCRIKGIYSPEGVLQAPACTRSRSQPQSMFLLSNLNSYISSTQTPPGTSHFRVDLAGCTSAV